MKPFENRTTAGNEKAIKRGKVVPGDAVGLSWVKTPKMTTSDNVILIDTSKMVEENIAQGFGGDRKLYYANSVGALEDINGNQIVHDEFPIVSDVFLRDEDFSVVPAEEYVDDDILSFVHISRYFHVDFAGLTLPHDLLPYESSKIKVVTGSGREYTNDDGTPRYKVKIAVAFSQETGTQNAYRLHVYVDTDSNEDLYLTYNKVEIDGDGLFRNSDPFHNELLNPIPYFDYTPEESEVVDPTNRDRKIYSTKPTNIKEQVTGSSIAAGKDGYKVYVPKKAVGDPRLFQLFHWRVNCKFVQQFKNDPSASDGLRCGIITTNGKRSFTPYVFLNLSRSQWNVTGMRFYNPLSDGDTSNPISEEVRETAEYWEVDFDSVTYDELAQFDILLWSPPEMSTIDISQYTGKIYHFTTNVGGTLFMDTNTVSYVKGMGLDMSVPVSLSLGGPMMEPPQGGLSLFGHTRIFETDARHELFEGALAYGGWNFNDDQRINERTVEWIGLRDDIYDEFDTLTIYRSIYDNMEFGPRTHVFRSIPSGWENLQLIQTTGALPWAGVKKPVLITRDYNELPFRSSQNNPNNPWSGQFGDSYSGIGHEAGNFTISLLGIAESVNVLCSHLEKEILSTNQGAELARIDNYKLSIASPFVEGAYKFLFNLCLTALKNKPLDSSDENFYPTSYSLSSQWQSSWVIDGEVLSENERQRNEFIIAPTDDASASPTWQRKLSPKTLKELIDESLTDDLKEKTKGASRVYAIQVTNSKVRVPTSLGDSSQPHAWTEEYSPSFTVPVELGAHIIREEEVKPSYEAGQYISKSYPAKPYDGRVIIDFVDSSETYNVEPVTVTVHGTATETITTGTKVPPSTSTHESEVQLTWAEHGSKLIIPSGYPFEEGLPSPVGLTTWKTQNYYNTSWGTGSLNWPTYGVHTAVSLGSRGEVVTWVQDAMNVFQFLGGFHFEYLELDGYFGKKTRECIIAFQQQMGCSRVTGICETETLSIIGSQIIRYGDLIYKNRKNSGWSRFYFWPKNRILRKAISDGNESTAYTRKTWHNDGPSVIWDMFMIVYDDIYNIHGVTLIPEVDGDTKTVMFRSIDVRKQPFNLVNYDSRRGNPIWMPHRPRDGQKFYVPFNARKGDTLIVGVGQDGPSGWGTSRMLGVRDIRAHARVKTTTTKPGVDTITKQTRTIPVEYTQQIIVSRAKTEAVTVLTPTPPKGSTYSNVVWESVEVDNSNVFARLIQKSSTRGVTVYVNSWGTSTTTQAATAVGVKFPDGFGEENPYYCMNPDSRQVSKLRESGWVSRTDGVKVLCDSKGKPVGFPVSIPSLAASAKEQQKHYSTLRLESVSNDASVQVGFYDIREKEFITNVSGEPRMTFIEYLKRGRDNVYVAVVSTYEKETSQSIPVNDNAPKLPYKWAMPVYGLYSRSSSRIGIGSLPKGLGQNSQWPIPIRTGSFDRSVRVPPFSKMPNLPFLAPYQNTSVTAHYSIPEAEKTAWSKLFGPPFIDIENETPEILDDDVLRISHAPIHSRVVPTTQQSNADPARAFFAVYKRDTVSDDWQKLPYSEIKDYNISTGEIFLKDKMSKSDPLLWNVDYTTSQNSYYVRVAEDPGMYTFHPVDLNPYSIYSQRFMDGATYIYIVPQHVRDNKGSIVSGSVNARTVKVTKDPSIFDATSPYYNPLALQLGVIYLNTATNIDDLTMLDVRKRGGGASIEASLDEIKRIAQEASNHWDMGYYSGLSYQKSGFVVIRLPEELKEYFSESEIRKVISKNITAGVQFKLEDLSGRDWS